MKKETHLEGEQFIISYELLHMLHWLIKFEHEALSKLVSKSFIKGIEEKAKNSDMCSQVQLSEEIQHSIVDFFGFIEKEIANLSDQESTKLMNKDIMETLDHIDTKQLDYTTIKSIITKNADKTN